jgi:hypothetical protein
VTVGREGWSGAAFERALGSTFRVGGSQDLLLDQVIHSRQGKFESASLRFRGKASDRLEEGSHAFSHRELGTMPIFIIPGTSAGGDCLYRVTLGRMV